MDLLWSEYENGSVKNVDDGSESATVNCTASYHEGVRISRQQRDLYELVC